MQRPQEFEEGFAVCKTTVMKGQRDNHVRNQSGLYIEHEKLPRPETTPFLKGARWRSMLVWGRVIIPVKHHNLEDQTRPP